MKAAARNGEAQTVRRAAFAAYEAGLGVWPPTGPNDRGASPKQPHAERVGSEWTWAHRQRERATPDALDRLYSNGRLWVGTVCGAVSGNLEALDFDDRETYERFVELARALGHGALIDKIEDGYCEDSPRGAHYLYRCPEIAGNTKLAARPLDGGKEETLIETRAEGGFIVLAPSPGYTLRSGGFATIATLMPDERQILWSLAAEFDERGDAWEPEPDKAAEHWETTAHNGQAQSAGWDVLPGDDFNARGNWEDVLIGWTKLHTSGAGLTYWRRPGKEGPGWSATTGVRPQGGDLLHVFSTSTALSANKNYTKFGATIALHHGGDAKAAAKALHAAGYGIPKPRATDRGAAGQGTQDPGPGQARSAGDDAAWIEGGAIATLADVEAELGEAQWLWDLWIQFGVLTAVIANGGVGKTRTVLEWAARLWSGDNMPGDGDNPLPAGTKTLWLCYDRGWRGLIKTARAYNLPREAILLPTRKDRPLWIPDFDNPRTMALLEALIRKHRPGFVAIDTTTYATAFNTAKAHETKLAFDPLLNVMAETKTACLALTHLNAQGEILNRRLAERARVVLKITRPDPGQPNRLRLAVDKTEDKKPPALGMTFSDTGVTYDDAPPTETGPGQRGPKPEKSAGFAQWLWTYLQPGPAPLADIIAAARDAELLRLPTERDPRPSLSPLYNARDRMPRTYVGKAVEEFTEATPSGKTLKHWRIADAPAPASAEDGGAPF